MYRVIVVEDEEVIRKGIRYSYPYEEWGCTVVGEARNGSVARDVIKEKKPHIVLTDIEMPIQNGLELIKEFKEYNISFIILSGYGEFQYVQEAIEMGAVGYLLKPIVVEELERMIHKAKKLYEMRKEYLLHLQSNMQLKEIDVFKHIEVTQDPLVNEMIAYIESNFQKKILMKDVCVKLNYSESLLNRRFKDRLKITFNEYLNRYRVKKAIEYMKLGNYNIKDIAFYCGFSDYKYFNQVFNKYVGYPMKEFLNLLSK